MSQQKFLEKRNQYGLDSNLKVAMDKLYILRYDLGLSDELNEKAIFLYEKIHEKNIVKTTKISDGTIRKRRNELRSMC